MKKSERGTKLAWHIYVMLLDGRRRPVRELLPYLYKQVNPTMAVRSYDRGMKFQRAHRKHGQNFDLAEPPLQYKLANGKYRVVSASIKYLAKVGLVKLTWPVEPDVDGPKPQRAFRDADIELTEKAYRMLKVVGKGVGVGSGVWRVLRNLFEGGLVKLTLDFDFDRITGGAVEEQVEADELD